MEFKPVFGRPGVDIAIRCVMAAALVILAIAAAVAGDLRQMVTVVALAAFATIQLVVLPPAVDRALHVVMWTGLVAWLALALS